MNEEQRPDTRTETREVSDFDRVSFSGIGTMTIARGVRESLEIQAHPDVLPKVTSEVRDGTLRVGLASSAVFVFRKLRRQDIRIRVTVRELRGLTLSGAGEVDVDGVAPDTFELKVSGAGNVDIRSIETGSVAVTISGAGDCEVAGRADSVEIVVSGAGDYDGANLESRTAAVKISGAGDVRVWPTESLTAAVSGAGSVRYRGEPEVTKKVTGVGSIRAAS